MISPPDDVQQICAGKPFQVLLLGIVMTHETEGDEVMFCIEFLVLEGNNTMNFKVAERKLCPVFLTCTIKRLFNSIFNMLR
jgi:hypothetical protein